MVADFYFYFFKYLHIQFFIFLCCFLWIYGQWAGHLTLVIPDQCKLKETMASINGTGRIRLAEEKRKQLRSSSSHQVKSLHWQVPRMAITSPPNHPSWMSVRTSS